MFLITKPSDQVIRRFISAEGGLPFSYPTAGNSIALPPGYTVDSNRIQLGKGAASFDRAVEAIKRWEMFNIGWVQLCWPDAPIEVGSAVAVLARHFGFWSLNACRIVRVIDENGPVRRYGFAYGTLPEHAERGEEQFTLEQLEDESVWYNILAYSQPNHLLAKVGYPVARSLQKRFARDSMQAMIRGSASC
jgi:uncharacterized protein (UPF0548 family)